MGYLQTMNVEVVQIQYKYLYQLLRAIRFRQMYPYWDFQVYVLLYSFFFRGSRCPIIFMLMIFFILGPCSHWFVLRWLKNEKEITHKKPYQSKDSSETVYFSRMTSSWIRIDKLSAEVPNLLGQFWIFGKWWWFSNVAVCEIFSCNSCHLRIQCQIASCCSPLQNKITNKLTKSKPRVVVTDCLLVWSLEIGFVKKKKKV